MLELGSFFDPELKNAGARLGPKYYTQEQCGRRVPKSEYTGRGWFKGCDTKADHGADLNMSRLLAAAAPLSFRSRCVF